MAAGAARRSAEGGGPCPVPASVARWPLVIAAARLRRRNGPARAQAPSGIDAIARLPQLHGQQGPRRRALDDRPEPVRGRPVQHHQHHRQHLPQGRRTYELRDLCATTRTAACAARRARSGCRAAEPTRARAPRAVRARGLTLIDDDVRVPASFFPARRQRRAPCRTRACPMRWSSTCVLWSRVPATRRCAASGASRSRRSRSRRRRTRCHADAGLAELPRHQGRRRRALVDLVHARSVRDRSGGVESRFLSVTGNVSPGPTAHRRASSSARSAVTERLAVGPDEHLPLLVRRRRRVRDDRDQLCAVGLDHDLGRRGTAAGGFLPPLSDSPRPRSPTATSWSSGGRPTAVDLRAGRRVAGERQFDAPAGACPSAPGARSRASAAART